MGVYAPTSEYDVASYETVMGWVRSVLRQARGMGADRFFIAGDLNVELGMINEETGVR